MQNNIFSTLFIGQNYIKLTSVDSTNTYLKNILTNSEPLPEGTVIMAENQFSGRGQLQNKWLSKPGENLTFSVYLKPNFLTITQQFYLNITVSLGVWEVLERYLGADVKIKWPNDIYYKDKKLGGILIENSIQGSLFKNTIIGIGINVNQQAFDAELSDKAISLNQILHKNVDINALMTDICQVIEKYYFQLKAQKLEKLMADYQAQLYQLHQASLFEKDGEVFVGVVRGVTNSGQLQIEVNHHMETYNFKEIKFIKPEPNNPIIT
ncbi:MAG: biotin--[acetyl-CoA-carboxylase] ligase [Pedobacter sp.]|nr:MAG: biotin--[acetyl-CoA-carboxylase] ligase [Pedobacter sp.]